MFTKTLAKSLLAAAVTAATSAAMADDITIVRDDFQPQATRADVRGELLRARAAGEIPPNDESASAMSQFATMPSARTREGVRAERREAPRTKALVYNPAA